jgi:hypothetical protein
MTGPIKTRHLQTASEIYDIETYQWFNEALKYDTISDNYSDSWVICHVGNQPLIFCRFVYLNSPE